MTYLIDNNVLSEMWKPSPVARVAAWWRKVIPSGAWCLPVAVVAEIQEGAERNESERRKAEILTRLDEFCAHYSNFVLPWDVETARTWGRLRHSQEVKRQPQALWDSLIDAAAVTHGFAVATRNTKDFRHADTFDPWMFVPED